MRLLSVALLFLLRIVCFTLFAVHKCILTLNIYKHTTSSSINCSIFVMRGISNIMCGCLTICAVAFLLCTVVSLLYAVEGVSDAVA